jgi:crotonobetainyl-CoA:carnitine CoA-transferase CaiB-like acyl-CoA transferase
MALIVVKPGQMVYQYLFLIRVENFCILKPDWTADSRYATLNSRINNSQELDSLVESWTINYTPEQAMALLQSAGVAAGVVATAQDCAEDPQLKAYDFFHEIEHPYIGKKNFYHPPGFTLSQARAELSRPTYLGEYTEYICTNILGIPDQEFAQMMQEGVFD